MKRFKVTIATFIVAVFGVVALAPVASVGALNPLEEACKDTDKGVSQVCDNQDENANDLIATVVNTLLFLVGTLSVIMIIVGGILYTTSTGDSGRVTRAKNTITYSIVGLVVSFLAYAIVNWVLKIF